MSAADHRILTTHVGSLVRPDDLIAFMRRIDAGEPYDEAAYERCLRDAVHEVVRQQRDAGIDIVSDGEFGKSSWNYYVYRRLEGFELRPQWRTSMRDAGEGHQAEDALVPTDWQRFPEFYEEYFGKEQGDYEEPGGTWA